ncbi:MAG: inner membrane protein YiaA [Massilia sp.]
MAATTSPSSAFVGAAWLALVIGVAMYLIGLFNATMALNEKGYYLTLLLYGLFAAVSVQKSTRDRMEGTPVTSMYFGLCWMSVIGAISLLTVGLFNASIAPSEKGFYAMSFVLSLFAAITVQKNVRDGAGAGQ